MSRHLQHFASGDHSREHADRKVNLRSLPCAFVRSNLIQRLQLNRLHKTQVCVAAHVSLHLLFPKNITYLRVRRCTTTSMPEPSKGAILVRVLLSSHLSRVKASRAESPCTPSFSAHCLCQKFRKARFSDRELRVLSRFLCALVNTQMVSETATLHRLRERNVAVRGPPVALKSQ